MKANHSLKTKAKVLELQQAHDLYIRQLSCDMMVSDTQGSLEEAEFSPLITDHLFGRSLMNLQTC